MYTKKNRFELIWVITLAVVGLLAGTAQAEMIGDTLRVGYTWFDTPQPVSSPNSLVYQALEGDSGRVSVLWIEQTGADSLPRTVLSTIRDANGELEWPPDRHFVDGPSAYSVGGVNLTPLQGTNPVHMLNRRQDDLSLTPTPAIALDWGDAFYDFVTYWPYSQEMSLYNSPHAVFQGGMEDTLHSIYTCLASPGDETMTLYYSKWYYSPWISQTFFEAIDSDNPPVITGGIRQPSSDIAVSSDGTHLAIAQLVARDEETGEREAIRSANNDLLLFESFDGGLTWNLDSPTNVTNWIEPDASLLPDTTAANGDTLRCITDAQVLIDANDIVHVFFTVSRVHYWQDRTAPESRIFHWDNDSHIYSQIADGVAHASRFTDVEGHTVSHPVAVHHSFGHADFIWAAYLGPSNLDDEEILPDIANGYACNDVWLSFSPNNGLNWTSPLNLTQTECRGNGEALPGDAHSETWLSITEETGYVAYFGNYLHLSYIVDTWPGDDPEESANEVNFHRVHTYEAYYNMWLRHQPETWDGLQRNYPLHVDSTGFYDEMTTLPEIISAPEHDRPVEFGFDPVHPNPFNPATSLVFRLAASSPVHLAIYNLLGQEVAVLLDRAMNAGEHRVVFSGKDLPSGMYFCRLTVGDEVRSQKMVLMK